MTINQLAELCHFLSQEPGLRIVTNLFDNGQLCVKDICERTGLSQPAASHRLSTLREAGMATCWRDTSNGRKKMYALTAFGTEIFHILDECAQAALAEGLPVEWLRLLSAVRGRNGGNWVSASVLARATYPHLMPHHLRNIRFS